MNFNNHHPFVADSLSPDDPLLSAYAFGELEGDELAAVAAAVAADPALAARVAELRAFGATLGGALAGEAATPPAGPAAAAPGAGSGDEPASGTAGKLLRFPPRAWAAAGFAAAAGLAVLLTLREDAPRDVAAAAGRVEPPAPKSDVAPVAPVPPPIVAPTAAHVATASPKDAVGLFVPAPPVAAWEAGATPPAGASNLSWEISKKVQEGRDLYLAGDLDSAAARFTEVRELDAQNPEARYFSTRISADLAQTGSLARDQTRAGMSQTVAKAWQAPGVYAETRGAFETAPAGEVLYGGVAPSTPVPTAAPANVSFVPVNALAVSGSSHDSVRLAAVAAETRRRRSLRPDQFADAALPPAPASAEAYAPVEESRLVSVEAEQLSTFSIDVDTASYANVRRFLQSGQRPPRDAVRVEELINYFPYRYAPPAEAAPFAAHLAVASAPWAPAHRLVRIGIKGRELSTEARPPASLVFLVDVSGSMSSANKLPLVKSSLRLLIERLRPDDRVAIVTYAGASGLALPSTPVERRGEILAALDRLESGGSTNGAMGIHLAYDIAKANFVGDGINRVILCTDGDFNVGVTDRAELVSLVQEKARARVFLTVLGFGMGNLKDGTLEQLADRGNGAYGYIDSEREARKVFVEQVEGTLATIAKDVKIQVEFNPERVASYRLIGYENRALAKEDFNDDRVDAGDVGAGHTVTALYEVVPVGAAADAEPARPAVDELKYAPRAGRRPAAPPRRTTTAADTAGEGSDAGSAELLTVKIRYKAPDGDVSRKLEFPLVDHGASFATADADFRFAAAVAAWGQLLRGSSQIGATTWDDVLGWAEDGAADDPAGHRAELLELVRRSAGGL